MRGFEEEALKKKKDKQERKEKQIREQLAMQMLLAKEKYNNQLKKRYFIGRRKGRRSSQSVQFDDPAFKQHSKIEGLEVILKAKSRDKLPSVFLT